MFTEMVFFVRESKLDREAAAATTLALSEAATADRAHAASVQAAILLRITHTDDLSTLPALPRLSKQSEWSKFFRDRSVVSPQRQIQSWSKQGN